MGDTFNNTFSGGGKQNIAQGKGAIGQTNNYTAPPMSAGEMLTLLGQVQQELSRLPLDEPIKEKVKEQVKVAQQEVRKNEPDTQAIAAKLTAATKVLAAIPATVAAAKPVGEMLGQALTWCSKMAGL